MSNSYASVLNNPFNMLCLSNVYFYLVCPILSIFFPLLSFMQFFLQVFLLLYTLCTCFFVYFLLFFSSGYMHSIYINFWSCWYCCFLGWKCKVLFNLYVWDSIYSQLSEHCIVVHNYFVTLQWNSFASHCMGSSHPGGPTEGLSADRQWASGSTQTFVCGLPVTFITGGHYNDYNYIAVLLVTNT